MHSRVGLALFAALLALDQLTKWAVLDHLAPGTGIEVTPFFNLVFVWNRGVSFGMLGDAPEWGRWALVALTVLIGAGLLAWVAREQRLLPRVAIWAILAGAVGNLIDRVRFGAVVDFLDFHLAGYHWPAFNVADSAIVIGAALLIVDGLFFSRGSLDRAEEKS
jgi:signal peptidase II